MTIRWEPHPERTEVARVSFAVRLVDLVTQDAPHGEPGMILEREEPAGEWTRLWDPEFRPVRTASGLLAHVNLERKRLAAGLPPARYRFQIVSPLYVPRFRAIRDWETIGVLPWDDSGSAPPPPTAPIDVELCPSLRYPFAAHVPVVRGTVKDKVTGVPLPDSLVFGGPANGAAITDERGRYALPLVGAPSGVAIPVGALDRAGRAGLVNVTLPDDSRKAVDITVPP